MCMQHSSPMDKRVLSDASQQLNVTERFQRRQRSKPCCGGVGAILCYWTDVNATCTIQARHLHISVLWLARLHMASTCFATQRYYTAILDYGYLGREIYTTLHQVFQHLVTKLLDR